MVYLGKNLAVAAAVHSSRLYLRINSSPNIYFTRPYDRPRVVAENLDLRKNHLVQSFFNDSRSEFTFVELDYTSPLSAASITALSIFVIVIMALKARFAAARSGLVNALVRATGVICQFNPHLSLHHPQALSGHHC